MDVRNGFIVLLLRFPKVNTTENIEKSLYICCGMSGYNLASESQTLETYKVAFILIYQCLHYLSLSSKGKFHFENIWNALHMENNYICCKEMCFHHLKNV